MLKPGQKMIKKWSGNNKEHFIKCGYVYTRRGDTIEVKAEHLPPKCNDRIIVLCDLCHKEFETINHIHMKYIISGKSEICEECKTNQKQQAWHTKLVEQCMPKGYTLLSKPKDLVNSMCYVEYLCPEHGKRRVLMQGVLRGQYCYECTRNGDTFDKLRQETFVERQNALYDKCVKNAIENGYTLVTLKDDFISCQKDIQYQCPTHGIQRMRAGNMAIGRKCPECAYDKRRKRYQLSSDEVERRVAECGGKLLNKEDYYNQAKKNLNICCPICNTPFITSFRNFTQHGGQICSDCEGKESMGEQYVRKYLETHNILFSSQKWFPDCRDINPLPFDFWLNDKNTAIEFDGSQHFRETNFFTSSFEETKKHDAIKDEYCKDKGIKLIRIPFWQINKIPDILDKELIT